MKRNTKSWDGDDIYTANSFSPLRWWFKCCHLNAIFLEFTIFLFINFKYFWNKLAKYFWGIFKMKQNTKSRDGDDIYAANSFSPLRWQFKCCHLDALFLEFQIFLFINFKYLLNDSDQQKHFWGIFKMGLNKKSRDLDDIYAANLFSLLWWWLKCCPLHAIFLDC